MNPKVDEPFFKEEDFQMMFGALVEADYMRKRIAELANAKLESALGPVVYSGANIFPAEHVWNVHQDMNMHTHTARLFGVREIEKRKCEKHEPKTKDMRQILSRGAAIDNLMGSTVICRKCGIELRAEWREVE